MKSQARRPRQGARMGPGDRIRRGAEFREVYDGSTALHGRLLVAFVLKSPGLDRRAGFVAGRKVGDAVRRNRARRLLREAYRSIKSGVSPQGVRLVFVAKAACRQSSADDLKSEMVTLLRRAGVLE